MSDDDIVLLTRGRLRKEVPMKTPSESERVSSYLRNAGAEVPGRYASGGRVKPNTTIQINIEREKPAMDPMAMAAMAKPPVVNPQPAPPPMDPAMMGGQGMAPGAPPMPGMRRGGRAGYAAGGAVKKGLRIGGDKGRGQAMPAEAVAAFGGSRGTGAKPMPTTGMAGQLGGRTAGNSKGASTPAAPVTRATSAVRTAANSSGLTPRAGRDPNARIPRASGGRATAIPMEAGAMSGDGRQNKAISQAKASGQKQPVKGTFRTAK